MTVALSSGALTISSTSAQQAGSATFFVTSVGPGKGGDLGGIDGADRHCQSLAQAAGLGSRTWRAYLSTQAADGIRLARLIAQIADFEQRTGENFVLHVTQEKTR